MNKDESANFFCKKKKNKKEQNEDVQVTSGYSHGIMAHLPWWLANQNSQIVLSNDLVFNK